jgi:hypothetical protein
MKMNKKEFYELLDEQKNEIEITISELEGDLSDINEILKNKPSIKAIKESYSEIYNSIISGNF